jgi:hypothetical protein
VGFGETNLGNNNLGAKRLSNGFCTNIPTYLVFQVNHKTSFRPQLVANYFLSVCWFAHVFLDHHKASFTLNAEGRRVGSHACRFHSLACISIMFYYSLVPLINSPISWRFGVTTRLVALCFRRTCSKSVLASHLLQCGWYLDCPKDSTPTLKIPLKENIKRSFMETFASSVGTQVEGSDLG